MLKAQSDTIQLITVDVAGECINQTVWTNCFPTVVNSQYSPVGTTASVSPSGFQIEFTFNESEAPYSIILDDMCLQNNGVTIDNYVFELNSSTYTGYSTHDVGNELHYSHNHFIDICYSEEEQEPFRLFTVEIEYVNCGNALVDCPATYYKDGIAQTELTGSGGILLNNVYDLNSLYTIGFEASCLDSLGVQLSQYTYQLNPQYTHQDSFAMYYYQSFAIECMSENDSCANFYGAVFPWIGYYQNTTNYVNFNWGNSTAFPEIALVTIDMPLGVTPVISSLDYPFTVSGSQLTLTATLPGMSNFNDVIAFNVPGGINNGVLHSYSISVFPLNSTDCDTSNNTNHLDMIVGNSYDPNDKTVNQPTIISPTIQDEFVYTVRFQNTGTAPAQDIYIIDTLSQHLDWSTFSLLESSHSVVVSNLGNGVMRFSYDGIWLPDSSTNLLESQGFFSYKILEKATNGEGIEIFNTAYIYFDHNPAIVTNTTYNINTANNLGLDVIHENSIALFPNPVSSSINVVSDLVIDWLVIYDVTGKECAAIAPNELSTKISVDTFESGVYFVTIKTEKEQQTLRFVKE